MIESDEPMGFCTACGLDHYGIEPDARKYQCEECETPTVYGAPELLIMGYAS
ncbi:MAG: hypothetical protein GY871_18140 [Actinomycetales bacterium]|nr:hypothetical protein [Actinomycetales bacterium]